MAAAVHPHFPHLVSLLGGFSSSHVCMWQLDHKESWAPKNWCFLTVGLEKTLESPLGCKEIQLDNPKGNQSWILTGRTDAEAETPILWPDVKNRLIGKDPDAGKEWRQEENGMTEDEIVGWHHWLYGHEFMQTLGVGDGQQGLACCGSWSAKSWTRLSDWTELKTTKLGLSWWLSGKEYACQYRRQKRHKFDPRVRKIP